MLVCLGTRTTIIIHNQSPPPPTRLSDSLRSQICPPMLMREVFGLRISREWNVFLLNNQPDTLIIQIYSVIKFYIFSGIFSAHHQEFYTVHSALVSFMQVSYDRFQADSAWKRSSETCMKLTSAKCTVENS